MLLKTNNNIILVLGLLRQTLVLYLNLIKSHWREWKPFGGIWEKHVQQNRANKNSQFTSRMVLKTLWHERAFERKPTKLSCGNKLHFRSYLGKRRLRLKNFSGAHQMRTNRSGWCEKSRTTKWWRIAHNRTILGWQFPLWDQSDVPEPGNVLLHLKKTKSKRPWLRSLNHAGAMMINKNAERSIYYFRLQKSSKTNR